MDEVDDIGLAPPTDPAVPPRPASPPSQSSGGGQGKAQQVTTMVQQRLQPVQQGAVQQWEGLRQDVQQQRYGAAAQKVATAVGGFVLARGTLRVLTGASGARRARRRLANDLVAVLATYQPSGRAQKRAARRVMAAQSVAQVQTGAARKAASAARLQATAARRAASRAAKRASRA